MQLHHTRNERTKRTEMADFRPEVGRIPDPSANGSGQVGAAADIQGYFMREAERDHPGARPPFFSITARTPIEGSAHGASITPHSYRSPQLFASSHKTLLLSTNASQDQDTKR